MVGHYIGLFVCFQKAINKKYTHDHFMIQERKIKLKNQNFSNFISSEGQIAKITKIARNGPKTRILS